MIEIKPPEQTNPEAEPTIVRHKKKKHKIFVGHFEVQNEVYLTRTENCVVANHIVIKLKQ